MSNNWITHVKSVQHQNSCSFKDALSLARQSYKKKGGGCTHSRVGQEPSADSISYSIGPVDRQIDQEINKYLRRHGVHPSRAYIGAYNERLNRRINARVRDADRPPGR